MSNFPFLKGLIILLFFAAILLLGSCKTCNCPAYSSLKSPAKTPVQNSIMFKNVGRLSENNYFQPYRYISATPVLPYPSGPSFLPVYPAGYKTRV